MAVGISLRGQIDQLEQGQYIYRHILIWAYI